MGLSADIGYEKVKLQEELTKGYWRLAFQELFSDQAKDFIGKKDQLSEVRANGAFVSDDELETLIRIGVIIRSDQSTPIEFIHYTFAEYFVAELLNNWLRKEHGRHPKYPPTEKFLVTKILLELQHKVIRLFLNGQLAKQQLPSDALEFYGQKVTTLWSEAQEQFFSEARQTALHISTQENNEQIIDLLLNIFNSDQEKLISFLTVRANNQETALYIAARNKNDNLIKKFLDSVKDCKKDIQQKLLLATIFRKAEDKDDPNIKYLLRHISQNEDYTAIKLISDDIQKKWELIKPFLETIQNANINDLEKQLNKVSDKNIQKYLMLLNDDKGNTVLHLTYELGHYRIIKWLIEHGASVYTINSDGDTILHMAARSGDLRVVELLIRYNANINAINNNGNSILHAAVDTKNAKNFIDLKLIKYLIEHRADVNTKNKDGNTVLDLAVTNNQWSVARFLITLGIEDINQHARAIVDRLINKQQWGLLQLMVEKGVDVNAKNDKGQTMLLQVADEKVTKSIWFFADNQLPLKGQWQLIRWLVERVGDINDRDNNGNTILHLAAFKGHLESIKWLVDKKNADVNAKNNNGDTVLHIITCTRQHQLVEWLVNHGADLILKTMMVMQH
ncbi:ankyrin repeat domain-containing protein [Rickettsia endosymbiont of Polydrusus tereticollis]|uniref:ankyrin repeat domain-containing protein n=1 Tax=Rickettsia endosymbiont of Polydrusus tereticollis TaxID=3066251 RepID=UPI0031331683